MNYVYECLKKKKKRVIKLIMNEHLVINATRQMAE